MNYQYLHSSAALILAAFGISAPIHEVAAGIFLAISCGYLVLIWRPEDGRKGVLVTLTAALSFGLIAAIAHPKLFPSWPVQLCMGMAGLVSSFALSLVVRFLGRAVERSDDIADQVVDRVTGGHNDRDS